MSDIEKFRPWIETRLNSNIKPKHKLLSRQLHSHSEPTLTIHTAGQDIVWDIPIREAAMDDHLLSEMDEDDQNLIRWLYVNDFDIEKYNYKKN